MGIATHGMADEVNSQLNNSWSVEAASAGISVQSTELLASAELEQRRDGSIITTGYVRTEWNGSREEPVLDFYSTSTNEKVAVDKLVEFCQSREELGDTVWTNEAKVVAVDTAVESIKETDAVFAAISEDHLARGLFEVIYHVPAGGDDAGVADALREFDAVEIGGKPYPIRLSSVLAAEIHRYRRVPLYAEAMSHGPKEVTVEDGVRQVTEFIQNDENPTPLPSESIAANRLVERLVEAGAVAVTVEPEISNDESLTLSVWVPDATAFEVVGQYQTISVEGDELDLNFKFCCIGGPNFLHRVPVYADDDIIGMESISIDEGVSNLREYVEVGCPRSVADTPWGEKR